MDNIEENKEEQVVASENGALHRALVWLSVVLTVAAWAVLLWFDGYAAIAVAVAGVLAAIIGARRSSLALKRLATTAIIASAVLIVVVAAFIIVIKIGLGA